MEERAAAARPIWSDARRLVWSHRRRLALAFVVLVISRLAALVIPGSSKFLIDEVIARQRGDLLVPLAAAVMGAALVQAGSSLLVARLLGVTAQRAIMDIRRRLQRRVTRLPLHAFDATRTGVLISRIMTDPDGLRSLLGSGLVQLLGSLLTAAFALVVLFWLDWSLTLLSLLALGAFAALVLFAFRRIRPLFRQRAELNAQVVGRLAESLAGFRVVKAYGAEKHEERVFTAGIHRLFRSIAREVMTSAGVGAAAMVIFGGLSALLILLGGGRLLSGAMSLGDLVMYVLFIGVLVAPLARIVESTTRLSEAFAGLDRIRELEAMATEDEEERGHEPLGASRAEIVFEDVTFEYAPGAPVLRGLSFRSPPGTTTALVGPSGAGKSTVISLVMGFARPLSGRVLLDGRDLSRIFLRDYRSQLGVVLQETFLFDGTIAENIAYSRPGASRAEVEAAARVSHCHEFVTALEGGYDTVVGERGVKLSGGQRQRVAIARAVLADPRILILDEATSQLDSESEALIQDGLQTLRRGRTTFVIAHRLSTIQAADQILVLDEGRIVERGTHETLLARGGRYRQLHERQHRLETDRFANPGETPVEPQTPSPARPPQGASEEPDFGPLFPTPPGRDEAP